MSTQKNPDGSGVSRQSSQVWSIAASTNASPIVLTLAAPMPARSGDLVEVTGHATNSAANGVWAITVVDSTHIALVGSVGTAAGGANGYVRTYSTSPLITVPTDGDNANGLSVQTAAMGVANNVPYVLSRSGRYRLHSVVEVGIRTTLDGTAWITQTIPPGVATILAGYIGGTGLPLTLLDLPVGESVFVSTTFTACVQVPYITILMLAVEYDPGVGYIYDSPSGVLVPASSGGVPITLRSWASFPTANPFQPAFILPAAFALTGPGSTPLTAFGPAQMIASVWRST